MKAKAQRKKGKSRRWKDLSFGRKVWRVVWLAVLGVWLLTVLQVLLGAILLPPVTPLMVQRFVQQLSDSERKVVFERDYVPLDEVSNNIITAVVYAEDGLFMYHHGFDVKQMKIAYRENKRGMRMRGASTISQQTAKNAFLPHNRTLIRKAVEAYYTVMIEAVWSKRRIMEVYLNIVEFGDGIYGVEAASQHYFGHSAAKLTRHEAAQLAATLPSPLKRNPKHATPYFRKQTKTIEQRFAWGAVDLDKPDSEKEKKAEERESLVDFLIWRLKQG